MNKNLILFTDEYPYGVGEAFIENEIKFLVEKFDKVIIVCASLAGEYTSIRELPDGVQVIKGYENNNLDKQFFAVIGSIINLFNFGTDWRLIKKYEKVSLFRKLYFGYTLTRARLQLNSIVRELKKLHLNCENTVLYSYWFNSLAYIVTQINQIVFAGKCKVISRAHRADLYDVHKYYSPLKAIAARNIDEVFACSADGMLFLKNKYPEYSNKFYVSYLGTTDFGISKGTSNQKGALNICSCSFIKPVKRVHLILEALSKINDKTIRINWTHFGDGNFIEHDLPKIAEQTLGSNINARFYGEISNQDLMTLYKDSNFDVFINVSESEGLPVSIMEAMSFGIPVIATDVGGTSEMVNEDIGCLVKKDITPEELADVITIFANMTIGQRNILRNNTRMRWERMFNSENNYREFALHLAEGM